MSVDALILVGNLASSVRVCVSLSVLLRFLDYVVFSGCCSSANTPHHTPLIFYFFLLNGLAIGDMFNAIGNATKNSLSLYSRTKQKYCGAADAAGNGSLMRLAPIPLFFFLDDPGMKSMLLFVSCSHFK